jgi:hypothetical protein
MYCGAASAARAYVEADRSRVDGYYLAEGNRSGPPGRLFTGYRGEGSGVLDRDECELWVAARDPVPGEARGRFAATRQRGRCSHSPERANLTTAGAWENMLLTGPRLSQHLN